MVTYLGTLRNLKQKIKRSSKMKVLVINPNCSVTMTESVKGALGGKFKDVDIVFATGPEDSPAEIVDEKTAVRSAHGCWRLLGDSRSPLYYSNFDGIVVACFSDHPLVKMIRQQAKTEAKPPPVCSLLHPCLSYLELFSGNGPCASFCIVTSSKEWMAPLDESIEAAVGPQAQARWCPTVAAGVPPLGLSGAAEYVARVIRDECLGVHGSRTVILGCAGYSGIRDELEQLLEADKIRLVEPCNVAVEFVMAAARLNISKLRE